jgi:DNA-binding response OmpR family regulator
VCLFDIRMPVVDGIEATRRLAGPDVVDPLAAVVITTFDLDEYVYAALRAGARGFLLKDAGTTPAGRAVSLVCQRIPDSVVPEFRFRNALSLRAGEGVLKAVPVMCDAADHALDGDRAVRTPEPQPHPAQPPFQRVERGAFQPLERRLSDTPGSWLASKRPLTDNGKRWRHVQFH